MKQFLRVEWQTLREKKRVTTTLLFSSLFLILFPLVAYFLWDAQKLSYLFSSLVIIVSIASVLVLGEEKKHQPMRRLLPSLPFTRSQIFMGKTVIKFAIWMFSVTASLLVCFLIDPLLSTAPPLPIFLIGASFSFLALSVEHLSVHASSHVAGALSGGFLGAWVGIGFSSSPELFTLALELSPSGVTLSLIFMAAGLLILLLNKFHYERRAL